MLASTGITFFLGKAGHPYFFHVMPRRYPLVTHQISQDFVYFYKLPVVFMPCKALRSGLYQIRDYAWLHLTGPLFQQPALTGFTLHKKARPYIISNSMLKCHILIFKTQLYFTKIKGKRKRTRGNIKFPNALLLREAYIKQKDHLRGRMIRGTSSS